MQELTLDKLEVVCRCWKLGDAGTAAEAEAGDCLQVLECAGTAVGEAGAGLQVLVAGR